MLFTTENYGSPITEELSEFLKSTVTQSDMADVASLTKVSFSTIKYVMYRNNSLTESNSVALTELIKIAIANCKTKIDEFSKAKAYFQGLLENVAV